MLEVRNLTAGYGALDVLHDVSFEARSGELIALLGGNGAGKTTTMNALAGIIPSASGSVRLRGDEIRGQSAHTIFGRGISLVPQGRHLFPEMTVIENLELGAVSLPIPPSELIVRTEQIFEWFPRLRERRTQRAGSLSGGEQQMLATGRALIARPALLLLDEPTAGLAPLVVSELARICQQLKESGLTMVLVEQNVDMALSIADRVYIIQGGRIVLESDTALIAERRDDIFKSYLGL